MMTRFEKIIVGILVVMLVLVAIMIATGELKVVIIVGEKLIDKAKDIDVKRMAKIIDIITH